MYAQDDAVYFGPADGIWGALSDETLLQLYIIKMLLYILVLLMVSGAFLVDEMLSWCSLQPVYVQDASAYFGPADRIWGVPVG